MSQLPDPYDILGVPPRREPRRDQVGLSQVGRAAPPRQEPQRSGRARSLQGDQRRLPDPERSAAARRVRSLRSRGRATRGRRLPGRHPRRRAEPRGPARLALRGLRLPEGYARRSPQGDHALVPRGRVRLPRKITYDRAISCSNCPAPAPSPAPARRPARPAAAAARCASRRGSSASSASDRARAASGRGHVVTDPCDTCRGVGIIAAENTLDVSVPPGIEDGATTLVAGAGNVARAGKAAGDLELVFKVEDHPFFKRVRDDVVCTVPISFPIAALGGEVEVPTLEGKAKVRVPARHPARRGAAPQEQGRAQAHRRPGRSTRRGQPRGPAAARQADGWPR